MTKLGILFILFHLVILNAAHEIVLSPLTRSLTKFSYEPYISRYRVPFFHFNDVEKKGQWMSSVIQCNKNPSGILS